MRQVLNWKSKEIDSVQNELLEEKAASYFRIARTMEKALAALKELDREMAGIEGPSRELVLHRASLLEEAAERVWFFVVQREAIGFRTDESLFKEYNIPEEVRRRMGPRKE